MATLLSPLSPCPLDCGLRLLTVFAVENKVRNSFFCCVFFGVDSSSERCRLEFIIVAFQVTIDKIFIPATIIVHTTVVLR